MEIGTPRIHHLNVTIHPNAEWTIHRFRECLTGEERYWFVIHDLDAIYSKDVDVLLKMTGLQILKTPTQSPQANAFCERLIGTIRRECLDFMIPLSGSHVQTILKSWVVHYNRGRPHSSLVPGMGAQRPAEAFPLAPCYGLLHCKKTVDTKPGTWTLSTRLQQSENAPRARLDPDGVDDLLLRCHYSAVV